MKKNASIALADLIMLKGAITKINQRLDVMEKKSKNIAWPRFLKRSPSKDKKPSISDRRFDRQMAKLDKTFEDSKISDEFHRRELIARWPWFPAYEKKEKAKLKQFAKEWRKEKKLKN